MANSAPNSYVFKCASTPCRTKHKTQSSRHKAHKIRTAQLRATTTWASSSTHRERPRADDSRIVHASTEPQPPSSSRSAEVPHSASKTARPVRLSRRAGELHGSSEAAMQNQRSQRTGSPVPSWRIVSSHAPTMVSDDSATPHQDRLSRRKGVLGLAGAM